MNMKWLLSCVAIITAAAVIGCTSMTSQQQGTLSGAAIGAAAGAGIAAISGGNGWTGAAIGAVAGGVVGNIKGGKQQK
ncbi:YMGG-like glycine zipper-containing protein [Pseudomonas sp. AOB-7]|uniref:YMGG-like glycine zipper-containing protein n=1 Tax=Pseudomonas sp. AOB-7 TaxID=2482750 RepID=UPI0021142676|nr:YMGG-like glycine zipper-containing protein [Pseudomonas sp. AOB-7]